MIPIIIETDYSGGYILQTYAFTVSLGDEFLFKEVGIVPMKEKFPETYTIIHALSIVREFFPNTDVLIQTDASRDVRDILKFKDDPSKLRGQARKHMERFRHYKKDFTNIYFHITEPETCHKLAHAANIFLNWNVLERHPEIN